MITLLDAALPAWRLYLAGIAILAAVSTLGIIAYKLEQRGAEQATTKIERANNANQDTAHKATSAVDLCYGGNGTWDVSRGVCVHSGAGQ